MTKCVKRTNSRTRIKGSYVGRDLLSVRDWRKVSWQVVDILFAKFAITVSYKTTCPRNVNAGRPRYRCRHCSSGSFCLIDVTGKCRRHVCTMDKQVSQPSVKRFEAYRKPTYQSYAHRCHNKICRGVRVVYETAYRDVSESRIRREPSYHCCPGWSQQPKSSLGCNTPVCSKPCLNSGTCSHPDLCTCLPGFTGQWCENG
ncbi:calcium ion binding [Homalodisca vitripennis]|nr:calcium ion binding [Homalodisca vitripennis]